MKPHATELLAPAQDLACGRAAVDCGADAVYIGAPRFGARARAGNTLDDITELVAHAHRYWARVYVTVNTLLHDDELPQAVDLIGQLYNRGVDAVIVQDVGLLACDLPPIPLIASTQMHNSTPARVAFLEQVGFQRVILARELSLEQIRAIREATTVELETFVHGALCVSYSGQCYMSYAVGGRSGNRGECAQPCRRRYTLIDRTGAPIVEDRYLLSLRDLNLAPHLYDLLDAGVTSFKIEGRLKDVTYVKNVVSFYRRELDRVLPIQGWTRSSSGTSTPGFTPDPDKTFNRGYTTYFLHGRAAPPGAIDSPKMVGELVGHVEAVYEHAFRLDRDADLHNGDGLCFFDADRELHGSVVNAVRGRVVTPDKMYGIREGQAIYRNRDHAFLSDVRRARPERRIGVHLVLGETPQGFRLTATDEDGNRAEATLAAEKVPARKPEQALDTVAQQVQKLGGTPFTCTHLRIDWDDVYFLTFSALNGLRRAALDALLRARAAQRPREEREIRENDVPYPEKRLTYRGNALNAKAVAFYRRHGVEEIEPAAESGLDLSGRTVMHTRYCILHQLGLCQGAEHGRQRADLKFPLFLVDEERHRYPLRFDCEACEMHVLY